MKYNMSCKEVEDFLLDYLEGNLGFCTRMRFRLHLLVCPDCPKYIQEYKNTIALGKQLFENPDEAADGKVPDDILEAILLSTKKKR